MLDHRVKLAELRAAIARHQSAPLRISAGLLETGLSPLDIPLSGGLPKGGMVEARLPRSSRRRQHHDDLAPALSRRSRSMVRAHRWRRSVRCPKRRRYRLVRLLWIRCRTAKEAFRAADLLLRDANLPLILFDIRGCPDKELRKVPSTTWYRFQRILEPTAVALLALTPSPQIPCALMRLEVDSTFGLEAMEEESESLVTRCHVSASRHAKAVCS
jgi:hypothetical protein